MALSGTNNGEKIWNYLKSQGFNDYGIAGLMGNLSAESGLNPKNLQNTYEKTLGYTDETYTAAVDNGTYTNFVYDKAGYGLAQWTYWSRKKSLYEYARSSYRSIGDLEMQLEFLLKELGTFGLLVSLKSAVSVRAASDAVMLQYEKPGDQSVRMQEIRAGYGQSFYDKYATVTPAVTKSETPKAEAGNGTAFSNSALATYTKLSPNYSQRTGKIDRITIHHMAGIGSVESCGEIFASSARQASANYGIGNDGRIGLYVPESKRAWTSSSRENDNRAVTIEVSNSAVGDPWPVSDTAYESLIALCTDICRRNGIQRLNYTGDTSGNLTMHCWFAATSCPGPYLKARFPEIAAKVNERLAETDLTRALNKLATFGVINSPEYWRQAAVTVPWLDALIVKAAGKIVAKGVRFASATDAIHQLVKDGIINTPEYWFEHLADCSNLDALMCALAGAEKG